MKSKNLQGAFYVLLGSCSYLRDWLGKGMGKFAASIGVLLWVTACASVKTALPLPSAENLALEASAQEVAAFARYEHMLSRLERVSGQVLQNSAELCPKTRFVLNATLHQTKSYPKHLRAAAKRRLGAQDTPSILFANERSGAAVSGLRKGDVLLDMTGRPAAVSNSDIQTQLQKKEALNVLRGGKQIKVLVRSEKSCASPVRLKFSGAVNAYASGKSIAVTTGMMDFTTTDAELALVVGHELAHNTMSHVRKSIQNTIFSGLARRYTRPFEAEADYVGLYYMARAGFDLSGVETFWRRLGIRNPKSIVRAKTHPVTPSRLLSIRMTAEEITQKRVSGAKLVPNSKARP